MVFHNLFRVIDEEISVFDFYLLLIHIIISFFLYLKNNYT